MTLPIGQVSRILHVHPNTIREWTRRYPELHLCTRSAGGNRRFDRVAVLALDQARKEGLAGRGMVERAYELKASPRFTEPQPLHERLTVIDRRLDRIEALLLTALHPDSPAHDRARDTA